MMKIRVKYACYQLLSLSKIHSITNSIPLNFCMDTRTSVNLSSQIIYPKFILLSQFINVKIFFTD